MWADVGRWQVNVLRKTGKAHAASTPRVSDLLHRLVNACGSFLNSSFKLNIICTLEQAPYDEAFICDVMKQTLRDARSAIQNCGEIH